MVYSYNEYQALKLIEDLIIKSKVEMNETKEEYQISEESSLFISNLNEKLLRSSGIQCKCCNGSGRL